MNIFEKVEWFACAINGLNINLGDKIPSERYMVIEFGWDRGVIREAIMVFEWEGVVSHGQGKPRILLKPPLSIIKSQLV